MQTRFQPYVGELETRLNHLCTENPAIVTAQVCTADGFAIASARCDEEAARRLAAMVSSLHALGDALVAEMQLGEYAHLSVEATLGKCVLFALPDAKSQLLLAAVADRSMLWGHFLFACRSACVSLGEVTG